MKIMQKSTRVLLTVLSVVLGTAFLSGCSVKAKIARHQQRADNYYAAGEFSKAEVEYRFTLRLDNENKRAVSQLGDIYFQQGRFSRAYAFVLKASQLATNDVNVQVKLATILLMMKKNTEARNAAEYVLTLSPTNSEAPDIIAESAVTRPDMVTVRKFLEAHEKKVGQTAPMELAFGILEYDSGDEKAAETALQQALRLDPKYSAAHYTMGNLDVRKGLMKEADAEFKLAAELAPKRSPRRLSYANFKLRTGDVAEGKRLMAEISKEAPDYIPAWIRQAEIALAEQRYDDCDSLLNNALAHDVDNYDALFMRGRLYLATGKIDKGVAEFSRMAALYDQSAEVFYQLGVAEAGARDYTKAVTALNRALFLRPKYTEAIMLLSGLNISKGDPASAIASLTLLLKDYPRYGQAYLLLGNAYLAEKNVDAAYTAFTKADETLPKNAQVPMLLGLILEQKKNNAAARKQFERAFELSTDQSRPLEELVNLDLFDNNFDAALGRLNKLTDEKLGPARQLLLAKVYSARAQSAADKASGGTNGKLDSLAAQPDVNLAEGAMLKAIDQDPTSVGPYLLLAKLYVATGKQQTALDRLNTLVSKTNSPSGYMQIGVIYEAMKDYPKARDAYEKSISLSPNFVPAINNLSYLYSERLNDLDKAYPLAKKATDLAPGDPASEDTLGWIVYKKGDYARARALLEDSAGKMPNEAEVQYHVGMARYMMGDEDPARQALQTAAASTADFPGKAEASRRLATLAINAKTADARTQADLEQRLKDEPNDPIAAERLGEIYERAGTLDKAAKTYEQSLKQDPQNGPTMGRLAQVYLQLKQNDKALDMAKDAHKLLPADAGISALLGRLVFFAGDYNWSASLLDDAAGKLPNQPEIRYNLAWAYYAQGRVEDARRAMQGVASSLTGAQQNDAKQFLTFVAAAKDPAQAAALPATQILSTNADYVPALMVAGVQAEKAGKSDDATQYYSKALARYPAFSPAVRNLVIIYSKNPNAPGDQKTYDLAMKARANFPGDTELTRALGVLAYRRGDYQRAATLLNEGSQTLTTDGELFYFLGMSNYQLKRTPPAKQALTRALALNVSSKYADDAKKVLAELK
jgi:tetratricopeptide (TPR) repeat protein